MDDKDARGGLRKVLAAILSNPQAVQAIIAGAGMIIGLLLKLWLSNQLKKAKLEEMKAAEQHLVDTVMRKSADEAAAVNANIAKADKAADDWIKKDAP